MARLKTFCQHNPKYHSHVDEIWKKICFRHFPATKKLQSSQNNRQVSSNRSWQEIFLELEKERENKNLELKRQKDRTNAREMNRNKNLILNEAPRPSKGPRKRKRYGTGSSGVSSNDALVKIRKKMKAIQQIQKNAMLPSKRM